VKPTLSTPQAASAAADFHREALDQALRQALGTSQPALRQQALDRAAGHLIHPRLVLESPLLADSHPWRREALAVSDAFEAVTNGMEEPGVFEALEDLAEGSPFLPWKHLILALHFFYEGLDEGVRAHLAQIPPTSPLRALAATLEVLVGDRPHNGLPGNLRRLADTVAQPDPRILPLVQDIAEGLESDHEALFWGSFSDWLEAVAFEVPDRARAAVLWAWGQLEWRDFDEQVLLDLGSSLWGRAESCRLAALGTLAWDPEGAALLWFRFLVTAIRDGERPREDLAEGRRFLDRFRKAALEDGEPSAEGEETWSNLSRVWNTEVGLRGWDDLALGQVPAAAPLPPAAADGQLDLFA
jgi:hypothetical protein